MKRNNVIKMMMALILISLLTGCSTFCTKRPVPVACGDAYEKIRPNDYSLSPKAVKKLKKMNKSIAEEDDAEVRLNNCINTVNLVLSGEKDKSVSALCRQEGLSDKEMEECKKTACRSRMKSEWCEGLADKIKGHLDACGQFEFDAKACTYSEKAIE